MKLEKREWLMDRFGVKRLSGSAYGEGFLDGLAWAEDWYTKKQIDKQNKKVIK